VHGSAGALQHEEDIDPLEGYRAVHGKKSQASMVDAGVRRNCRQVVSVSRTGAGGISVTAGERGESWRLPRGDRA
jgi:hypothetical protein